MQQIPRTLGILLESVRFSGPRLSATASAMALGLRQIIKKVKIISSSKLAPYSKRAVTLSTLSAIDAGPRLDSANQSAEYSPYFALTFAPRSSSKRTVAELEFLTANIRGVRLSVKLMRLSLMSHPKSRSARMTFRCRTSCRPLLPVVSFFRKVISSKDSRN